MTKNIKKVISYLLFLFILTFYFISYYISSTFDNIPFDQLLFTIMHSKGTNPKVIIDGVFYVLPRVLLVIIIFYIFQKLIKKYIINSDKKIYIDIKIMKKQIKYQLLDFTKKKKRILYCGICIILICLALNQLNFFDYIYKKLQTTKIYEEYYVNPKDVNITFNNKRNLIYIVLESEEMTNASIKNGGGVEKSYIPNLEKLAIENTNFSNNDKLGGALQVSGTSYTAASLVSQTSATPVSVSLDGNSYSGYSSSYPGIYSIGEVLEKNGYKNYFMLGSNANFGGRKEYFEQHGNYKVMDYYYAIDNDWLPKDYNVWWGYEDKKLFEFAKKELTEISKNDEPFNFTLLTVDTHFTDGYFDETCKDEKFSGQYENVYYCNDNMIYDFVKWIMEQDFYKNTTVIISGDHLTMQSDFYKNLGDYQRTVYNVIINSEIKNPKNTKNRQYSVIDMYPTTLASIGAVIDGDKLGFGVNLYSSEKTLIEKLGFNYVNEELQKNSIYYNEKRQGKTYNEVKKKEK